MIKLFEFLNFIRQDGHYFSLSTTNDSTLELSIEIKHKLHIHRFVFVGESYDSLWELVEKEDFDTSDCGWSD